MRWQAPTIVIAIPISAIWRARSVSTLTRAVSGTRAPANVTSATCSTGSNTELRRLETCPATSAALTMTYRGVGHHRQPLGAVSVQYLPGRAVQQPSIGIAASGDPGVDRGPGYLRLKPIHGQRRELAHRCQKWGGIGAAAQLFQRDGQLYRTVRVAQLSPAEIDVNLPHRARVDAVFGNTSDQRRRALFGDDIAHGFLP